jgi:hypothetical protein
MLHDQQMAQILVCIGWLHARFTFLSQATAVLTGPFYHRLALNFGKKLHNIFANGEEKT